MPRWIPHPASVRLCSVAALFLGVVLAAATATAAPRDPIIKTLEAVPQSDALGLEAWLHGATGEIRVGEEVGFRFRSQTDVYLTTVYVDASGSVTVLHTGGESNRLTAGQTESFPPEGSNQRLVVQPPYGSEAVFAIATLEPLPQEMFADEDLKMVLSYERPEDGRHLAQRLADYVSILPDGSVDVAWFSQDVVPESAPQHYSSTSIVEHFTTRTRSLSRPKLDLDIQFRSGSDELTPEARKDLDELGQALRHPAMKNRRFELGGHTDDVGAESYNMTLSKKRAQSALEYLTKKYEIDPNSLRPAGYGEVQPLMPGTSEEARRRNRRVVIEQLP